MISISRLSELVDNAIELAAVICLGTVALATVLFCIVVILKAGTL